MPIQFNPSQWKLPSFLHRGSPTSASSPKEGDKAISQTAHPILTQSDASTSQASVLPPSTQAVGTISKKTIPKEIIKTQLILTFSPEVAKVIEDQIEKNPRLKVLMGRILHSSNIDELDLGFHEICAISKCIKEFYLENNTSYSEEIENALLRIDLQAITVRSRQPSTFYKQEFVKDSTYVSTLTTDRGIGNFFRAMFGLPKKQMTAEGQLYVTVIKNKYKDKDKINLEYSLLEKRLEKSTIGNKEAFKEKLQKSKKRETQAFDSLNKDPKVHKLLERCDQLTPSSGGDNLQEESLKIREKISELKGKLKKLSENANKNNQSRKIYMKVKYEINLLEERLEAIDNQFLANPSSQEKIAHNILLLKNRYGEFIPKVEDVMKLIMANPEFNDKIENLIERGRGLPVQLDEFDHLIILISKFKDQQGEQIEKSLSRLLDVAMKNIKINQNKAAEKMFRLEFTYASQDIQKIFNLFQTFVGNNFPIDPVHKLKFLEDLQDKQLQAHYIYFFNQCNAIIKEKGILPPEDHENLLGYLYTNIFPNSPNAQYIIDLFLQKFGKFLNTQIVTDSMQSDFRKMANPESEDIQTATSGRTLENLMIAQEMGKSKLYSPAENALAIRGESFFYQSLNCWVQIKWERENGAVFLKGSFSVALPSGDLNQQKLAFKAFDNSMLKGLSPEEEVLAFSVISNWCVEKASKKEKIEDLDPHLVKILAKMAQAKSAEDIDDSLKDFISGKSPDVDKLSPKSKEQIFEQYTILTNCAKTFEENMEKALAEAYFKLGREEGPPAGAAVAVET